MRAVAAAVAAEAAGRGNEQAARRYEHYSRRRYELNDEAELGYRRAWTVDVDRSFARVGRAGNPPALQ